MGVGGQHHAPAALTLGKRPGTHCIGGWWAPGPVWTVAENLAPPTGIQSPDLPARSECIIYYTLTIINVTCYQYCRALSTVTFYTIVNTAIYCYFMNLAVYRTTNFTVLYKASGHLEPFTNIIPCTILSLVVNL